MADSAASPLLEQLNKAFLEFQSRRDASSGDKVQWKEIQEHFHSLDAVFKEKFIELEAKEEELEQKESETALLTTERKAAIAAKKQEMLDRVQELKDVAIASISASQQQANSELVNDEENSYKENKVSSSPRDENSVNYSKDFQTEPQKIHKVWGTLLSHVSS